MYEVDASSSSAQPATTTLGTYIHTPVRYTLIITIHSRYRGHKYYMMWELESWDHGATPIIVKGKIRGWQSDWWNF